MPPETVSRPSSGGRWKLVVAGVCLVAVLAVASVLLVFLPGGMGLADYRDRMGRAHDRVGSALADLEQSDPSALDFNDPESFDLAIDDLSNLEDWNERILGVLSDVRREVEGISPPEEAASLHEDILDFYEYGAEVLGELGELTEYLYEVLLALRKDLEKVIEVSQKQSVASIQEIMLDVRVLHDYCERAADALLKVQAPEELKGFNERFVAMWRGGEKILTDIEECMKRFDSSGVDTGVVSLSSWFEEEADLLEELDLYVSELDEKYQDMVDEGMEIEERINEL